MRMPKYKWDSYSKEELQEIIDNSKTYAEVMRKLNYSEEYAKGNGTKIIRKMAEVKKLDISSLSKKTSLKENHVKVGDIYGKWTVRELIPSSPLCISECECGRIKKVYKNHLRSGRSTSCGNCSELKPMDKIGMLTIIEKDEEKSKKKGRAYFKCQCECGTVKTIMEDHIKSGATLSCGCIKSHGNLLISQILTEMKIPFQAEKSFEDLKDKRKLYFDFAVFNEDNSIKYLIEYNGYQHYYEDDYFGGSEALAKQQKHDQMKRDYCQKFNYKMIEIPYWHYNKLNKEYFQFLI